MRRAAAGVKPSRQLTSDHWPQTWCWSTRKPLCRWCQGYLPTGRRTFCSEPCVVEIGIRTSASYAREMVARRDRGVCARCGFDTHALGKWIRSWRSPQNWTLYRGSPGWRETSPMLRRAVEELRRQVGALGYGSRGGPVRFDQHLWEMDHFPVPVDEGGGGCGLDNLRTLCLPCHRLVTAEQAARRADRRRRQMRLQEVA